MSNYTTGRRPSAAACRCAPSSTTTPGHRIPSQLTEGGRRLYSEENLKALQTVCFLRSLGLGLEAIRQLMADDNSQQVISCCWSGGRRSCGRSWNQRRQQLDALNQLMAAGKQFPEPVPGNHRRHSLCHETEKTTSQTPPDPAADGACSWTCCRSARCCCGSSGIPGSPSSAACPGCWPWG